MCWLNPTVKGARNSAIDLITSRVDWIIDTGIDLGDTLQSLILAAECADQKKNIVISGGTWLLAMILCAGKI